MIRESRIPSFTREDLDLPVTWRNLNEVHIPLPYAFEKAIRQVVRQLMVFVLGFIPVAFLLVATFRPFMHAIKPLIYDTAIRANLYIALVVVSLWLLSRLRYRTSLKRLQFLLHIVPVLSVNLLTTFSWG